jgi:hypothetical protein
LKKRRQRKYTEEEEESKNKKKNNANNSKIIKKKKNHALMLPYFLQNINVYWFAKALQKWTNAKGIIRLLQIKFSI